MSFSNGYNYVPEQKDTFLSQGLLNTFFIGSFKQVQKMTNV